MEGSGSEIEAHSRLSLLSSRASFGTLNSLLDLRTRTSLRFMNFIFLPLLCTPNRRSSSKCLHHLPSLASILTQTSKDP